MNQSEVMRWDIWYADLPKRRGSHVQDGYRPVLVISNHMANRFSPVITVIPITGQTHKKSLPTHILLKRELRKESLLLVEQIMTIDRSCMVKRVGKVKSTYKQQKIEQAVMLQLGIKRNQNRTI